MVYLIAFLVPVLVWILSITLSGIFPFGTNSILTSDLAYQYIGYFEYIHQILTENISPFFSFYKGLGEETLGMISYYMMSPFNLLVGLFPKENITEAILIINLLKIGASGLTFSIFIKNKFKDYENKNLLVVAFSCCYALMAYNIAYQFNIMWLDGVIWLPIVILGIDRIINKNRSDLFYISLSITIISNWYIGFMVCVFSGFYVLYNLLTCNNPALVKRVLKKFILFGVLAAGTALFVILPAVFTCLLELKRSGMQQGDVINYSLIDIFSKFVIGGFNFEQIKSKEVEINCLNVPNLFAGTSILILFVLYFINKSVDKKEKIRDGVFFGVLILTTLILFTNRIWHVFTYNVWFPYRYSFCITFFMIYIAYKSFLGIKNVEQKTIWKVFLILTIGYFIIEKLDYTYITSELIYCTIFMLFAVCIVIKSVKNNEKSAYVLLLIVFCAESFINASVYMRNFEYFERAVFYIGRNDVVNRLETIEDDEKFYRIEQNLVSDYNAALGLNYLGITNSTSMGRESSRGLLESLGYTRVANNFIKYAPSTKFADSFLGIKYYLTHLTNKNEDALSLGFLVNNSVLDIKEFVTEWKKHSNSFEKQNELIKKSTDITENLYNKLDIFNIQLENLERAGNNNYEKIYPGNKALYSFNFKAINNNEVYLKANGSAVGRARIFVNDEELSEYMTSKNYSVIKLGEFSANEIVNVDIEFIDGDIIEINDIWVYYEDIEVYRKVIDELKRGELNIKNMTSSTLEGEVNVYNENQLLLLTVPYDKYLKVYVDGSLATTVPVLDSLTGIHLNQGNHSIEVRYEPDYFIFTLAISGVFIVFAGIIIFLEYRKNKEV